MADTNTGLIRPNYFDRQQLTAADLNAEQQYVRERLRRHNRFMHGWGVVCGAQVTRVLGGDPWEIAIGEGYAVTPHGDEIYIPSGTTFNTRQGVEACLGVSPPCPGPEDLSGAVEEGTLRIIRASIDPTGKDVGSNYNQEWVDLLVLETTALNGYRLDHIINPDTPQEGREPYFTFSESEPCAAGTVIRIHSGAQRHHVNPEPEFVHRYRASQIGNWRLNNTGDTIFVLNAEGDYVTSASFLPESPTPIVEGIVFLVACPAEALCCPRPGLPAQCQPPGGLYEYSRICETVQFRIVCASPPSHSENELSCEELEAIVCDRMHVQCPQVTAEDDNCVVLARLAVGGDSVIDPDDAPSALSRRRQLLSESLIQAYEQCQCEVEPPKAAFASITPTTGQAPLTVSFDNQSTGIYTACHWDYGDGTTSGECEDHKHIYTQPGVYTVSLTVSGPGGTDTATRTRYIAVHPALSACALEILERGTIHVALHDSFNWPFAFADRPRQRGGFLPDLVEKIVGRLFETQIDVDLSLMNDDQYLTSLAAGAPPDLYLPRTPENLQQALQLWTHNYFLDGLRLLINPAIWEEEGRDPNNIRAWDRTTIGVQIGDETAAGIVLAWANATDITLKIVEVQANPLKWLDEGMILGFCTGWSALLQLIRDAVDTYSVVGPMLFVKEGKQMIGLRPLSIIVRPNCPGFRDEIDEHLVAIIQDGTWSTLYNAWFPDLPPWTSAQLLNPDLLPSPFGRISNNTHIGAEVSVLDLIREANQPVERIDGIGTVRGTLLHDAGVDTLLAFTSMPVERAAALLHMPEETIIKWQADAWGTIMSRKP